MTNKQNNKFSILGLMAALIGGLFGRKKSKITADDLKQNDFSTSTQSMGVRFTEKIRSVFRHKWLRKR